MVTEEEIEKYLLAIGFEKYVHKKDPTDYFYKRILPSYLYGKNYITFSLYKEPTMLLIVGRSERRDSFRCRFESRARCVYSKEEAIKAINWIFDELYYE